MSSSLTIAIAQINPTVGDIAGNSAKILEYYKKADADLVVFPELSLIGYPPEDLVLTPSFRERAMHAAQALAAETKNGPAMIIGSVWGEHNAALLLDGGEILHVQAKTKLPNYGIFDEKRLFTPGDGPKMFTWRGRKLGMLICEDMWYPELAASLAKQGAELLIVINASPFEAGKLAQRKAFAARAVAQAKLPLVYVNMVGGQDDIVFDGGSFVLTSPSPLRGEGGVGVNLQMSEFVEQMATVEYAAGVLTPTTITPTLTLPPQGGGEMWRIWNAMALGLRDYVRKNGFSSVVLGLSGGIDSAVSAAVAVDALGAEHVTGVLLPSPYTSKDSVEDALLSAKLLGIKTMNTAITPGMEVFEEVLNPVFTPTPALPPQGGGRSWMEDIAVGGNLQARLRGITLMAISNRFGWLLLSTGNKSELAVGYSTLYGDSCGGFNVLKDAYKTQVYALAKWRNQAIIPPPLGGRLGGGHNETLSAHHPHPSMVKKQYPDVVFSTIEPPPNGEGVIPGRSITKAPTAELAPGQTDQDQLPPYEMLDAILALHIEGRMDVPEIVAKGFAAEVVQKILKLVRMNEYKRRQSCPGVKLSPMMFGRDRRFPLTNKF